MSWPATASDGPFPTHAVKLRDGTIEYRDASQRERERADVAEAEAQLHESYSVVDPSPPCLTCNRCEGTGQERR